MLSGGDHENIDERKYERIYICDLWYKKQNTFRKYTSITLVLFVIWNMSTYIIVYTSCDNAKYHYSILFIQTGKVRNIGENCNTSAFEYHDCKV